MTISEVIKELESIKQEEGDIQVTVAFAGAIWSIFDVFSDKNNKERMAVLDIDEYCPNASI